MSDEGSAPRHRTSTTYSPPDGRRRPRAGSAPLPDPLSTPRPSPAPPCWSASAGRATMWAEAADDEANEPVVMGLVAALAAVVLFGGGLLFVRVQPHWVAMYRGRFANLRGAVLSHAPLARADLSGAYLQQAVLTRATLKQSNLADVDLTQAKREGAGPMGPPLPALRRRGRITGFRTACPRGARDARNDGPRRCGALVTAACPSRR
jgi:hypothetical protein